MIRGGVTRLSGPCCGRGWRRGSCREDSSHGGFAFGIDRLTAILAGEENIREVIAFPKTQSGLDPMTNAPTTITDKQLTELSLRVLPPKS